MTSLSGAEVGATTQQSRRLSVLPTVLGVIAVVVLVVGASISGVAGGSSAGPALTWVAAAFLLVTIASGHPVGLYTGLVVFVVAVLVPAESASFRTLAVAAVVILAVHEIVRPSLDARRPARFGPQLWVRHLVATGLLVAGVVALARLAIEVDLGRDGEQTELPNWLVPVGLVLAGLPLLIRRFVAGPAGLARGRHDDEEPGDGPRLGPPAVRLGLGVAVAATAIVGAILGAGARPDVERPPPESDGVVLPVPTARPLDATIVERGVGLLLFFVVMVVLGFLYVALKRPEVDYELDDLDMDLDETSLELAGPGQADLEDEQVEIDERELLRLLDDLALDIGAEKDPGRAIRFAYANVERRLEAIDVVRAESETEQEFLTRALPSLGPRGPVMVELTDLFERARFGHSPVTEDMRSRALVAVDVLRTATAATIAANAEGDAR